MSSREAQKVRKTLTCPECGLPFETKGGAAKGSKCPECRKKYYRGSKGKTVTRLEYRFKYPEDTFLGKFERSGLYIQKSCSLAKLGFDFENPNLEEEYLRIQKLLVTEYEINLKSADQIEKEYGLAQNTLTTKLIKYFDIKKRCASEAESLAVFQSGLYTAKNITHYQYQSGHHTDWEGKDHFLRSSYEFDLAKRLDERQIHYETEVIRVRYFDTQNRVYKTGVPDFYLPDFNMIIETKGSYFYDNGNLTDRKAELNKLGFKFYVLLEKEKVLEDFKPLEEIEDNYINIENFLKNPLLQETKKNF